MRKASESLVRAWNRWVRGEPGVGPVALLLTAIQVGLATGIVEGTHTFVRKAISPLGQATLDLTMNAVWLAPLMHAAIMLIVAAVLGLVLGVWRRPVSVRLVMILLVGLGAYSVLRSVRLGIGVWPVRLLALGVAVRVASWAARRGGSGWRPSGRLTAGLAVWVLASGSLLHGSRAVREWRALRTLPSATTDSPNVLLLILDTVRAQSLSLYRHEHPTTPALDALAAESTVFDGAVSVSSWTLPSHASMFTGYYPWELSVDKLAPLDDARPTLAERLDARGYATAGFVGNFLFAGRAAGMARGFSHFEDTPISLRIAIASSWLTNRLFQAVRQYFGARSQLQMKAGDVSEAFLRWSERQDRPFFAMLNFMDAHAPYCAPDSLVARFASGRPRNWLNAGRVFSPEEMEELHESYDAAIAYIDQEIGRIVERLRERGELDRTIIIVTADHGEQLGEHDPGLTGHANSLYASLIRVPLLVRFPALVGANVRRADLVSIRSIPATVMGLVDPGRSALFPGPPLLAADAPPDATAAEDALPLAFVRPQPATTAQEPLAAGPMASAALGDWHYIRDGAGAEELYDWNADPWERDNRVRDPSLAVVLARLRLAVRPLQSIGLAGIRAATDASAPDGSTQAAAPERRSRRLPGDTRSGG
ncbi:MAG: sulfatase [Gemmatimonadota bacterium]